MTTGIYKLIFNNTDKVYIGQSINIEKRYQDHLSSFKRNTSPNCIQQAYIQFGVPILEIIEECDIKELNTKENEYISKYNSFINGFNSMEKAGGVPIHRGYSSAISKYTREQLLEVFNSLIDYTNSFICISKLTGVGRDTVADIAAGRSHKWLEEEFPDKYQIMLYNKGIRGTSISRNKLYPAIISPKGIIYSVTNIREFARNNKLDYSCLNKLLNGKQKSHLGWRLK